MNESNELTTAVFAKAKTECDKLAEEAFRGIVGPPALILATRAAASGALLKAWTQGWSRGMAMGALAANMKRDAKAP